MSSKRRTSRSRHRKVRRNRYVLVNKARGALRRLTRNVSVGGIDVIEKIVFPALGATGGMLLAQYVGSKAGPALMPTTDPRIVAVGASAASALAAYLIGERVGLSPETQASIAAGAGVVGMAPWLPFSFVRATVAQTTDALAPAQPNAVSGYYQRSMLGGLMVDVSHAGAPYKGMFGLGGDGELEDEIDNAEAVSIVEPIDMAREAVDVNPFPVVRETMATPGDRGWAGGIYARNLFSGLLS